MYSPITFTSRDCRYLAGRAATRFHRPGCPRGRTGVLPTGGTQGSMGRCPREGDAPMSDDDYPDTPTGGFILPGSAVAGSDGAQRVAEMLRAMIENDRKVQLRDEIDSAQWIDSVESSPYRVAMTRAQLNRLLHHGHPIPVTRGITKRFIDEHYPSWSWNSLTQVLKEMGVVRGDTPPHSDPGVGAVHLDGSGSWMIQWEDGHIDVRGIPR